MATDRKVIHCEGLIRDSAGETITMATGKYIRLARERSEEFLATLVETDATRAACRVLRRDAESAY